MINVINTITVKPGYGDIMRERFKSPKHVHKFPGFVRMELLQTQGLEQFEEYQVCTVWERKEDFDAWVQSEFFRNAHMQRKESGNNEMVIGNKITIHEVIVTHLPGSEFEN